MKRHILQALLLAGCAALPLLATADDDHRGDRGWSGSSIEWRDGPGTNIYFRYPGDREWRRAPGSAHDVGDGWVIGTDRRNGGYGIYRWSGNDWQRMPGAAVQIGGSYSNPWVVNDRGERFAWTGYEWREELRDRNYRRDNDWDRDYRYDYRGDYRNDRRDHDRGRRGWRNDR